MSDAAKVSMDIKPITLHAHEVRCLLDRGEVLVVRAVVPQPAYQGIAKMVFESHPFAPSALRVTPAENLQIAPEGKAWLHEDFAGNIVGVQGDCPFGSVGEKSFVRELWALAHEEDGGVTSQPVVDEADWKDYVPFFPSECVDAKGVEVKNHPWSWRDPDTMPEWASRLTVENKSVRVMRVKEIDYRDAIAAGIPENLICDQAKNYTDRFHVLWDSLHKPELQYVNNPWVWASLMTNKTETLK